MSLDSQTLEDGSIRSGSPPVRAQVAAGMVALGFGGSPEKSTGFRLQNGDEVNCFHVGFVLTSLGIGEFAFVTFAGQAVDASLGHCIEAVVDEFTSDLWSEHFSERMEKPVKNWRFEGLHKKIVEPRSRGGQARLSQARVTRVGDVCIDDRIFRLSATCQHQAMP